MRVRFRRVRRLPDWPLWSVVLAGVWLGMVGLIVLLSGGADAAPSTCLFHRLTGLPCPTCGMTRGATSLACGDLRAALRFNPLMMTLLAASVAALGVRLATGWWPHLEAGRRARKWLWILAAAGLLINWAYLIHIGV